jgi:sugar/nucleoside kinase (ribokinase family)
MAAPLVCTVGDLLEDIVVRLSGPPAFGDDTLATIEKRRGGSAATVAASVVLAGGRARFAGRVGDDELATALTARLEAEGVETIVQRAGRTGTVVSLVHPDGERTMLSDRGSAPDFDGDDASLLDGAAALHLPAYSIARDALAVSCSRLAAEAGRRELPLTIDASAVSVVDEIGPARFRSLLGTFGAAVLFANEAEAEALGLLSASPPDLITVVKQGPDPVIVVEPNRRRAEVPAEKLEGRLDTTGAGDAFAAAFLLAWLQGASPVEAAAAGNAHAAERIRGPKVGP